ncbi:MAG: hypothetical protein AAF495_10610 [Pseudomonadota bacterium]
MGPWRQLAILAAILGHLIGCAASQRPVTVAPNADGTALLRASGAPGEGAPAVSRDLLTMAARLARDWNQPRFAILSHYLETLPSGAQAPTIRVQTPIARSKRRNRRSSGSYVDIDLNSGSGKTVETVVMIVQPFDGDPPAGSLETYSVAEILQD